MNPRARVRQRGMTLIEVMIASAIMGFLALSLYGAFYVLSTARTRANLYTERYRLARNAMNHIVRDLSSAYISFQYNPVPSLNYNKTAFVGSARRVDFNSFTHIRLVKDSHESDQCELGYFLAASKTNSAIMNLVRREKVILNDQFGKGGVTSILVDDVDTFTLRYYEPVTQMWVDTWDTTSLTANAGSLPLQVEVFFAMRGWAADKEPIRLKTRIPLMIRDPLSFALK